MKSHWILRTRFHRSYESSVSCNYGNHSKFQGRSTSLPGLQNQYTGYSYNLASVTYLAIKFEPLLPHRLLPVAHDACG